MTDNKSKLRLVREIHQAISGLNDRQEYLIDLLTQAVTAKDPEKIFSEYREFISSNYGVDSDLVQVSDEIHEVIEKLQTDYIDTGKAPKDAEACIKEIGLYFPQDYSDNSGYYNLSLSITVTDIYNDFVKEHK